MKIRLLFVSVLARFMHEHFWSWASGMRLRAMVLMTA